MDKKLTEEELIYDLEQQIDYAELVAIEFQSKMQDIVTNLKNLRHNQKYAENLKPSDNNDFKKVCPECGSPTLSRISENVIGCSNPKCTYIGKPIPKS